MVLRHETPDSGDRGVLPEASDLSIALHTVVLQSLQRNGLVDTLDLLWLGVNLLLTLLTSSTKTKDQVQGRFLLDVVVAQGAAILKLLSSENETLLIRWDSFLVLDLGLDVVNGVGGLDIQGDGLACIGWRAANTKEVERTKSILLWQ